MPCFFTIGCTIGPAVGGYFSRPAKAFPSIFRKARLFIDFPYLLPNFIQTSLFVDAEVPLLSGTGEEDSYGTDSTITVLDSATRNTTKDLNLKGNENLTFRIWNPIIAVCILCSHALTYIQLPPIFLQTKHDNTVPKYYFGGVGGLDYPLYKTGQVMGIGGLISLGVQSLLFSPCTEYFGAVPTYAAITLLHPLAYFTISYIAFLPHGVWQTVALYSWMTVRTIFSVFPYPLLLIFVKRATPCNSMLGRVNGIVLSSGAAFRSIASAISGGLQTIGEKNHISALPWWGSGYLATVGALQTLCTFLPYPNIHSDLRLQNKHTIEIRTFRNSGNNPRPLRTKRTTTQHLSIDRVEIKARCIIQPTIENQDLCGMVVAGAHSSRSRGKIYFFAVSRFPVSSFFVTQNLNKAHHPDLPGIVPGNNPTSISVGRQTKIKVEIFLRNSTFKAKILRPLVRQPYDIEETYERRLVCPPVLTPKMNM
ncbi:hypothetical protein B0J14DRAFT_563635 [Halenospora varia]|nr:hypothetical protein B0J14DRAFT_563635 [Halenospora varia]